MVARPPRLCFFLMDALLKFMVWSDRHTDTLFRLPRFFSGGLPTSGLDGLWLQADNCCSRASWVGIEVTTAGSVILTCGW